MVDETEETYCHELPQHMVTMHCLEAMEVVKGLIGPSQICQLDKGIIFRDIVPSPLGYSGRCRSMDCIAVMLERVTNSIA